MKKITYVTCRQCGIYEIDLNDADGFDGCVRCGDAFATLVNTTAPEIDYSLKKTAGFDDWYIKITPWLNETAFSATNPMNDDVDSQARLMNELSIRLVYIGKLRSDAKYYLDMATGTESERLMILHKDAKPSIISQMIKSKIALEESAYNNIERLGSTVTHRMEALRSAVSLQKTLLQNIPSGK